MPPHPPSGSRLRRSRAPRLYSRLPFLRHCTISRRLTMAGNGLYKVMLNVWNPVRLSSLQSWKVWSLIDENEEKPLYMYDFSISKVMAFVSSVTGQVPRKSCRPKLCCAKPVMSPKIHSLVARNPESYSPIFYRVYKLEKSNILCKSQGINS